MTHPVTITFTGDWPAIREQMRAVLATQALEVQWLQIGGESIPAAVPVGEPAQVEPEKPKASKAKAKVEPAPAPEPEPEAAPAPEPEAQAEPAVTYNTLSAAVLDLIKVRGRDVATAIFADYGAATARELPESAWAEVYAKVKEAAQ